MSLLSFRLRDHYQWDHGWQWYEVAMISQNSIKSLDRNTVLMAINW